ncbi:PH domain-containing protein [Bacteroides sp. GM023]|uniref:PH domain-containing protein n=1 Tax=Bacteroides sp. GM023 TaxID=2723058 RepID=UPI00168B0590|nr:PH domain-containing protein [Bacteroides sp. GM023]MBD3588675.1 PH domain-containing protein [Bacteroides sp. GM023]
MNRIFHARIAWYQYFLLVVLTVNVVGALWCKYILPAVLLMLMLIIVIEQIIHTVYTVTPDGILEISTGRFIRKKVIPVSEITAIKKCHSMKFGRFSVTEYVLIEYGKGKFVSVMPVKEREFAELLEKRIKAIHLEENK